MIFFIPSLKGLNTNTPGETRGCNEPYPNHKVVEYFNLRGFFRK
jgi:hypothetical protein